MIEMSREVHDIEQTQRPRHAVEGRSLLPLPVMSRSDETLASGVAGSMAATFKGAVLNRQTGMSRVSVLSVLTLTLVFRKLLPKKRLGGAEMSMRAAIDSICSMSQWCPGAPS